MIEIIEFLNAIFLSYVFFKMNFKTVKKSEENKEDSSVILYQVIVRCVLTDRDYPSTLVFKSEEKAEAYKNEYASALIQANIFKTQKEFSIRIEPLKAIL